MKILNFTETKNIFDEFLLSTEELIKVRGGDGEGTLPPAEPPVKI